MIFIISFSRTKDLEEIPIVVRCLKCHILYTSSIECVCNKVGEEFYVFMSVSEKNIRTFATKRMKQFMWIAMSIMILFL